MLDILAIIVGVAILAVFGYGGVEAVERVTVKVNDRNFLLRVSHRALKFASNDSHQAAFSGS